MLALMLLAFIQTATAQRFDIRLLIPHGEYADRISLSIYDGSKRMPQYSARLRQGECTFEGTLMKNQPYYAELSYPQWNGPIGFFIEPGSITVDVNGIPPEGVHVRGSKSNSQYRMLLEMNNTDSLVAFVLNNPSSVFSPTLIYQQLSHLDYAKQQLLFDTLSKETMYSSHYRLLKERLEVLAQSAEGVRIHDFVLPNGEHIDSLLHREKPVLLRFGASWCDQCKNANLQLDSLDMIQVDLLIDKLERGWDNPLLHKLNIEYIPNYILLSPEGIILRRNMRWWEILKDNKE